MQKTLYGTLNFDQRNAGQRNMKELSIGTHLSVAKGYAALAKDAVQIGANTFQLFIRNPRRARAKELKPGEIETFLDILQKHGWS